MALLFRQWVEVRARLGRERFEAEHDFPFLIQLVKDEPAMKDTPFVRLQTLRVMELTHAIHSAKHLEMPVHPVRKREGSNSFGMITVGRAANNDIVIASCGTSKFHASFREVGGQWYLEDAASTNGTILENVPLSHRKPTRIPNDSIVVFGHMACRFVLSRTMALITSFDVEVLRIQD